MHKIPRSFHYKYSSSISTYSTNENMLLPDSFNERDSLIASTPATVSPDIYFASNPSTSRSPSPFSEGASNEDLLLHDIMRPVDGLADLGQRHFRETIPPPRSSSLRGSYDSFFRLGLQQRRCKSLSRGSANVILNTTRRESDSDYASSHYSSDSASDSDSSDSGSSTDAELLEDALPAVCATAIKVKITPLRAVRRTVRRSYLLDASRFPPRKSSAEEGLGAGNPYWGIFVAMAARDASAADENREESLKPQVAAQTQGQWSTLTRKLSIDNLRTVIARKPSAPPIGPLDDVPAEKNESTESKSDTQDGDAEGDVSINIMEFHDVTQEAARIAAMMSFRWEYKAITQE